MNVGSIRICASVSSDLTDGAALISASTDGLARDPVPIVRLALVVVIRQRRQILRDRRPHRVELDRVSAVEHRDRVRLLRRELRACPPDGESAPSD